MSEVTTSNWIAWVDKMPVQATPSGTLHIIGKVDAHSTALAFLRKRALQGINDKILIIDLLVVSGFVPVENPQWVHREIELLESDQFNSIEIIFEEKKIAEVLDIPVIS